ncbi:MAG: tetratricopeptide repeat protein, partial [Pseudomonas sp.]
MSRFKCVVLIASLLVANGTWAEEMRVTGVGGHALTLQPKSWPAYGVTSTTASFTANGKTFPLYGPDTAVEVLSGALSPDRKTLLVSQAMFAMLSDGSGEDTPTSRSHCDVISMETGCVLLQRDDQFCSGEWVGDRWKPSGGEALKPELETPSPQA